MAVNVRIHMDRLGNLYVNLHALRNVHVNACSVPTEPVCGQEERASKVHAGTSDSIWHIKKSLPHQIHRCQETRPFEPKQSDTVLGRGSVRQHASVRKSRQVVQGFQNISPAKPKVLRRNQVVTCMFYRSVACLVRKATCCVVCCLLVLKYIEELNIAGSS